MSILDMASGQGPDIAASPEASTGWPTTLGSDGQARTGSILYDSSEPSSPLGDPPVEPASQEQPIAQAPQAMPQLGPDPEALLWHNQGLLNHIQQLEARQAQLKPLEDLFRYDPTAYTRVVDAIMAPYTQQQAPQSTPQPQQRSDDAEVPAYPWERPPAAEAQTQAPAPQGMTPEQVAQMQAVLLANAVSPIQSELYNTQVKLAEIELRDQISKMQSMYGDQFNPQEVVAYALGRGIRDLNEAYKGVLGEKVYRQTYMSPGGYSQPGPRVGGYAATSTPPPAAAPVQPSARVEPTRARSVSGPSASPYPPNYKPGSPQEAASYALHLLRDMRR